MSEMGYCRPKLHFPSLGRGPAGGAGRVRGADVPGCGATHLTFPRLGRGPLPL